MTPELRKRIERKAEELCNICPHFAPFEYMKLAAHCLEQEINIMISEGWHHRDNWKNDHEDYGNWSWDYIENLKNELSELRGVKNEK